MRYFWTHQTRPPLTVRVLKAGWRNRSRAGHSFISRQRLHYCFLFLSFAHGICRLRTAKRLPRRARTTALKRKYFLRRAESSLTLTELCSRRILKTKMVQRGAIIQCLLSARLSVVSHIRRRTRAERITTLRRPA